MNTKVKIALIIIVTLVIGIVLGAMLNRAFLRHRIHRAFADRNPAGMISFIEKDIRPTPDQREKIREVLEKHRKKSSDLREKFMMEMQAEFESLEAELDPILTSEQKNRLKRRFRGPWRDPRRFPDPRRPRRKPPREKLPKEQIK
jgi:predicted RNase H-like nuclease (RuvC/YqgF family)